MIKPVQGDTEWRLDKRDHLDGQGWSGGGWQLPFLLSWDSCPWGQGTSQGFQIGGDVDHRRVENSGGGWRARQQIIQKDFEEHDLEPFQMTSSALCILMEKAPRWIGYGHHCQQILSETQHRPRPNVVAGLQALNTWKSARSPEWSLIEQSSLSPYICVTPDCTW